jgi:hypothetical protein
MTSNEIEFGLDTPVVVTVDESGHPLSGDVVIRNTIEEAVLADAAGIDSFNIGEHYRPDLMDAAGPVILAAIGGGGHSSTSPPRPRRADRTHATDLPLADVPGGRHVQVLVPIG